jgi:UDPglucose--hexose-1-phosphate uridylyltransferase
MAVAPEWRFDPLTGRRVLISPDRAGRPRAVGPACPFCEGHESETPPEVLAYRLPGSPPNGPGWRVRVVPNRYAAVRLDAGEPGVSGTGPKLTPVADAPGSPGFGIAEVILESPQHETAFRNLSQSQATDVIRAWRDRLRFWRDDGRLAFAQVFKNEGPAAGASVEHCHSQLIGIPFVPPAVEDELRRVASGRCPYCDSNTRLSPTFATESDHFLAMCPIAPRFPGETWVLPKEHAGAFETTPDDRLLDLVRILFDVLARMDHAFGQPDYNLIVRSAPFRHDGTWHWRIELLPRVTTTAGWEWGTGLLINIMFPEHAARLLRDAG